MSERENMIDAIETQFLQLSITAECDKCHIKDTDDIAIATDDTAYTLYANGWRIIDDFFYCKKCVKEIRAQKRNKKKPTIN